MSQHTYLQTVIVGLVVLSAAIGTPGVATVSAQSQQANYSVDLVFPDQLSTGSNQTVGVRVNNTANTNDVFSPVVEIPIGTLNLSTDAVNTTYVGYDGGQEYRTAEIQDSTLTDGKSLFIFGENVPAGENRTYYFNITIDSPGNRSLTAEVRPLYNEDIAVQTTEEVYAKGTGTLSVSVVDSSGNVVDGADLAIDGSTVGGNEISQSVLEGEHTVSLTNPNALDGETIPATTVSVSPLQSTQVTFVVQDSLTQPVVLVKTGSAQIIESATGQVTEDPTAEQPKTVTVTFLLSTAGGETIVGHTPPAEVQPFLRKTVTSTAGTVNQLANDSTAYRVKSTSDTDIAIQYIGYRLGDITHDEVVTTDDAAVIANHLAYGTTSPSETQYGDVNGDGEVTPVDAMMIAQYTAGNRDANYTQEGSQ